MNRMTPERLAELTAYALSNNQFAIAAELLEALQALKAEREKVEELEAELADMADSRDFWRHKHGILWNKHKRIEAELEKK